MPPHKKVKLVFPDAHQLWAFVKTISTNALEINRSSNTLTLDCSDEEITRAVEQFGAKLSEGIRSRNDSLQS